MQIAKTVNPIRLLPPALRNQIAAGEVVERPSSVLKELVENSLDAGADEITVTIEDGGQRLLAVRDNGHGMPPADLELAVTRHATSKVASFADLLSLATYGFRGEALPSIASVADILVESVFNLHDGKQERGQSVTPDYAGAAFIRVRHGEIVERGISALPRGTLVEVRDLFANVPARLKFLKTPATELKRCQELLGRIALARLDVGFVLNVGGEGGSREALRLFAGESLFERLSRIWPAIDTGAMLPFEGESRGVRIRGLAAEPRMAQTRGDRLLFYVNGRPVGNRLLAQAARQAYKGMLTSREHPVAVVFVELDPAGADVNVHPAKTEVRFRDEQAVFGAVLAAMRRALTETVPSSDQASHVREKTTPAPGCKPHGFWGSLDDPHLVTPLPRQNRFEPCEDDDIEALTPASSPGGGASGAHFPPLFSDPPSGQPSNYKAASPRGSGEYGGPLLARSYSGGRPAQFCEGANAKDVCQAFASPPGEYPRQDAGDPKPPERYEAVTQGKGYPVAVGPLVCLGQVADTYLVLVGNDALLLLDQHAAHERVLLHDIKRQTERGESQILALPVDLSLDPAETGRLQDRFAELTKLGFALKVGQDTVSVTGVPPLLGRGPGVALLKDILGDRADGMEDLLHLMACHSAIKAGQTLTADEAAGLLSKWLATPDRDFCPHGRPVVLRFDLPMLERMFKRKIG